jgi:hypothetical protein
MTWLYWARVPFALLLVAAVLWLVWLAREYEQ